MTDKIKCALLGNRQAQNELATEGISLPCPFCGAEMQTEKGYGNVTFFRCQDRRCGACISFGGVKKVMPRITEAARPLRNFNRRTAKPVEPMQAQLIAKDAEVERLTRERDAAVDDIEKVLHEECGPCGVCEQNKNPYAECKADGTGVSCCIKNAKWRGV